MKLLYMSDFCKLAGIGVNKTEEAMTRLSEMGVEPMALVEAERDGAPFERPLYARGQLAIVEAHRLVKKARAPHRASDDRMSKIEQQIEALMAKYNGETLDESV